MPMQSYPLAVPEELLEEIRNAASSTRLTMAEAMRQSMKLGLPKLVEQLRAETALKPFTASERKAAFAPDEFDQLAKAHASRSRKPPEAD